MRMNPHHLIPGDKSAIEGTKVNRSSMRRVVVFARPYSSSIIGFLISILVAAAIALEKAGVFAIVLELMPADLAARITKELSIPTVGIGAGVDCDSQVLVWTDLMGITKNAPKLAKAYRNLRKEMSDATKEWAGDVAASRFPGPEQSFK